MSIRIYNTLTGKEEEFKPLVENEVRMYVCGPTVYDEPHIGHARSAYVFDVIRRYFIYKGYKVRFVRNITDVDDKIINKAREECKGRDLKKAVGEVTRRYTRLYHDYMKRLGIMSPDAEPRATEYIGKMQEFIKLLIERGVAYEVDGDVYFDISRARAYGRLSNQNLESLKAGARILTGEKKRDPLDFALWKKAKDDDVSWDSPWGKGRPGWHIECSVMSMDILGDEFDIHGGGIDLIFPHHENELAQSEGAGRRFARYWIHNGLLTIRKEKMAKSSGNFITIKDVLSRFHPDVLKVLFLQAHYSHPVDFSWEKMEEADRGWERFVLLFQRLHILERRLDGKIVEDSRIREFIERFESAMDDNFNTAGALAVMFEMAGFVNKTITEREAVNPESVYKVEETLRRMGNILGLFQVPFEKKLPGIKEEDVERLIEERDIARKKKDFKKADAIRAELEKKGIILEDHKEGTTWRAR